MSPSLSGPGGSPFPIPTVDRQRHPARRRIEGLQRALQAAGLEGAFLAHSRSLFYYAGFALPANLWVPARGEPVVLTRRVHALAAGAVAEGLEVVAAPGFADLRRVLEERGLAPRPGQRVGAELDVLPAGLVDRLRQALAGVEVGDVSPLILRQRAVKDPEEVEAIQRAAQAWEAAHQAVLGTLRPGVGEHELAAAIEHAFRARGGMGQVWFRRWDAALPGGGEIAGGPRAWVVSGHAMTVTGVGLSAALPWGASRFPVEKGELVVVDYGVCIDGYHADIARTYCLGRPSSQQADLWMRLQELHEAVVAELGPGVPARDVYRRAARLAERTGLGRYFMGVEPDRGTYIGHGIGLEIDEWPLLAEGSEAVLEPGMVVTIEPKFMVPGVGGVMVEDDFLLTPTGCRRLCPVPAQLFQVD